MLLVHGGFGSWSHWARNIDRLSKHYTLWTCDLPGLGSSGDLAKPWTSGDISDRMLAGWRHLQGSQQVFDICGFSFGGLIAGLMAATAGDQCRRCVLIGASGFGPLHVQVDLLPPPSAELDPEAANAIHRENLARLMLHKPDTIDALAVYIHSDNLARHRLRSRRMAGGNALARVLPRIAAQLVGVWGEYDATAGGRDNIEARKQLFLRAQAGAEFYLLPDVGHWAMYEAPDRVEGLIVGRGD